jgi:hypothetical protein
MVDSKNPKPFISLTEAATKLKISKQRMKQLMAENSIEGAYQNDVGFWFIPEDNLYKWRQRNKKFTGRPAKKEKKDDKST